jgi:hypothetical protein
MENNKKQKVCAFHSWRKKKCEETCKGRTELPLQFSTTFTSSLNFRKSQTTVEQLEETINQWNKFKTNDFVDYNRDWGNELLTKDDPIWLNKEFQKDTLIWASHPGNL